MDLTVRIFQREGPLYITCNDRHVSFTLKRSEIMSYGLVRKCVKLLPLSLTRVKLDLALNYIDKICNPIGTN